MSKSLFLRLKQFKKKTWIKRQEKMTQTNIFESIDVLEPRCPKCEIKLDYGVNTSYNDKIETHICNECGTVLK